MSSPIPRVVTVGPYVLLAVLVILTVIIKRSEPLAVDLGLCALAAVWMLWMFTLHPAWRDGSPMMAVFVVGLIVIMAFVVVRDPWFGCFTPAMYLYAFRISPLWSRMAAVAGVAAVAGTAQAYDIDKATLAGLAAYAGVVAVNVLPLCGFAWFAHVSALRNEQRIQALTDLSDANHKLAATLAENAGLHEQLLVQAREAGMLDERQRMAREIHDTLAQGLIGIITQLQAAEQAGAGWHRHVTTATTLARESLSEARRSVAALRPESLEGARLSEALAVVAERWSAVNGIAITVTTTGTPRPLAPDAEVALLRTAQEALANVAKHARATRAGLTLSYLEGEVALDVRDDGSGFSPDRSGRGFGLVSMRQRIEGLSGTLQVESEPDAGTAISARIPGAFA